MEQQSDNQTSGPERVTLVLATIAAAAVGALFLVAFGALPCK